MWREVGEVYRSFDARVGCQIALSDRYDRRKWYAALIGDILQRWALFGRFSHAAMFC